MGNIGRHDKREVYLINATGEIVKRKFVELVWASEEQTTTPHGIGSKVHVRGSNIWTWGHCGNFPRLLEKCETEEEALERKFKCAMWDFETDINAPITFNTEQEAQEYLREQKEREGE